MEGTNPVHDVSSDSDSSDSCTELSFTDMSHKTKKQCLAKSKILALEKHSKASTSNVENSSIKVTNLVEQNTETFKVLNNQDIDFKKLVMIKVAEHVKHKEAELFAHDPNDKMIRYCQVFYKNELCNASIEFQSVNQLSKRGSQWCTKHVERQHPSVVISPDPKQFLNAEHSPVKRSMTKSVRANITTMLSSPQKQPVAKYSVLEGVILRLVLGNNTFNQLQNPRIKEVIKLACNDENIPLSIRKMAPRLIIDLSERIIKYFQDQLQCESLLSKDFTVSSLATKQSNLLLISRKMGKLKVNTPIYLAMETDGWKSNKKTNYHTAIFLLKSAGNRRVAFYADYSPEKKGTLIAHREYLQSICEKYNAHTSWVNTCTDNASGILFATSSLKCDARYPLFAGHFGCLCHILNLICEKTIKCLSEESSSEEQDETSNESESELEGESASESESENDGTTKKKSNRGYRDIMNEKLSVHALVTNPFKGIPKVLQKLIDFSAELNRSAEKMESYDTFVGKRIPRYMPVRWNVKHDMLEVYVEKHKAITKFMKFYESVEKPFRTSFTGIDLEIATLIVDILEPFKSLTHLMSENCCLSPLYVPLLIFIRNLLKKVDKKLTQFGERNIRLENAIALVDKYLYNTKENYDVLFTCLAFQPSAKEYVEFFKVQFNEDLDLFGRLTDLVFTVGRIVHSSESQLNEEERKLNTHFKLHGKTSSAYNYDQSLSGQKEFRREIEYAVAKEHLEYTEFMTALMDEDFKRHIKKNNIKEEAGIEGFEYYDCSDGNRNLISDTKIFLIKTEILLNAQYQYRRSTNSSSHHCGGHIFLPVVMDYLLSFAVTSVNAERSFSKLKRIYSTDRHNLDDRTVYAILNCIGSDCSGLEFDILKDFTSTPLWKALGYGERSRI